ncbi:MAG: peptide chain release factor 2 [Sphaerochaetaceae bacterium]
MILQNKNFLDQIREESYAVWGVFDPDKIKSEIETLEKKTQEPDFWNDKKGSEATFAQINSLKDSIYPWQDMIQKIKDLDELIELYDSEDNPDQYAQEIDADIMKLYAEYDKLKTTTLLSGMYDKGDCFLSIHAGAGGTEACDWTQMLLRMYTRWCERHGFKTEILDMLEDEGGIKSVTVQVKGMYAYGYLKGEAGVHRLVRISPFDSNARRHTSFSSVYISPILDDSIEINIKPEDIRIDTYRSGGAGGQHVNKTDSAVRITHYESGIVVQCQNERSQIMNKDMAFKMLRSRLYQYYKAKKEEENAKHAIAKKEISWGSQIRSYVFQPYTMVKDLRTGQETGNINAVMDGELDPFIESFLNWYQSQGFSE